MQPTPVRLWDTVALLTLFDQVNQKSRVDGNLKAQKLAFLAELEGQAQHLRAAHFRFFRYNLGPYSAQLADTISKLEDAEILSRSGRTLTKRGRFILEYVADAIAESHLANEAIELLRTVGRKYGGKSGASLRDYVYTLRVPVFELGGEPLRVRDIPIGLDILDPIRTPQLQEVQPFNEDLLNDLRQELAISPANLRPGSPAVKRALAEAFSRSALTST